MDIVLGFDVTCIEMKRNGIFWRPGLQVLVGGAQSFEQKEHHAACRVEGFARGA